MNTEPVDFDHLDRMQHRIMTPESYVTEQEFRAEPESEQLQYYNWMRKQIGELADLI
jgi:hypothetical protein